MLNRADPDHITHLESCDQFLYCLQMNLGSSGQGPKHLVWYNYNVTVLFIIFVINERTAEMIWIIHKNTHTFGINLQRNTSFYILKRHVYFIPGINR